MSADSWSPERLMTSDQECFLAGIVNSHESALVRCATGLSCFPKHQPVRRCPICELNVQYLDYQSAWELEGHDSHPVGSVRHIRQRDTILVSVGECT